MKQLTTLGGIALLLLVIVTNAAHTAFDSYYGFYYEDEAERLLESNPLAYLSGAVAGSTPVRTFCGYTGFGTGYGFFAPNVASDFITLYNLEDESGTAYEQLNLPPFRNKESVVRYLSATGTYMEKITKDSCEFAQYHEFLDVIQRQMADYVRRRSPAATSVTMDLYLYDYVTLAQAPTAERFDGLVYINSQTATRP